MLDNIRKSLLLGVATLALGGFLAACERQEGTAEEAGEAIDQGAREAAPQGMESMGEQPETGGEAAPGQQ